MTAAAPDDYGFLLAHFVEDAEGYAERIHFSLSEGDDPLRWDPLWGGRPVLTSDIGTTGVRDPAIVRDAAGRFHILATDLRVWGGDGAGWDGWRRHGSRSLILWDSDDLVGWTGPRAVEVAPENAGMAWAPEVTIDPATGEHVVFWSSTLFAADDPRHEAESYSRILMSRTTDFVAFGPAEILIDAGRDVIDTAIVQTDGAVIRIGKNAELGAESWGVFQEVGSGLRSHDFRVVARGIGADVHRGVEAPVIVEDPRRRGSWYLLLDQYSDAPQGYFALETHDLASGDWTPVPAERVRIPPATKHGTVLRLRGREWSSLRSCIESRSESPGDGR